MLKRPVNKRSERNKGLGDTQSDINFFLSAQDLMRGYRIDIWDSVSKKWLSLCKRIGTYKIFNDPANPDTLFDYLTDFEDESWWKQQ